MKWAKFILALAVVGCAPSVGLDNGSRVVPENMAQIEPQDRARYEAFHAGKGLRLLSCSKHVRSRTAVCYSERADCSEACEVFRHLCNGGTQCVAF